LTDLCGDVKEVNGGEDPTLVRIGIKKEQWKSLILCKDREFKQKAVQLLNSSAFVGEKLAPETIASAIRMANSDPDIANFVFDGSDADQSELLTSFEQFKQQINNPDLRVLIYLDHERQSSVSQVLQDLLPDAAVIFLPQTPVQYKKAFHGPSRTHRVSPAVSPEPETEAPSSASSKSSSVALVEASAHIKDAIELLNSVAKDRSRLDILQQIDQKFNGLIGSFAFFGQKDGYKQIKDLAYIIDGVARSYQNTKADSPIEESHWQMILDSAKTLSLLLRDMRVARPMNDAHLKKAQQLWQRFEQDQRLEKRSIQSQDGVDELFAALNDPDSRKAG